MANIGFIGLGNMGRPMVKNLLKSKHRVTVFDLDSQAMAKVVKQGAYQAKQLTEVCNQADVVISMLPAGQHVCSVYLDDDGLINSLDRKTRVIDCSTIDVESTKRVAAQLAGKSISFVDAPVSGGVSGAERGTLSFMVGGSSDNFALAEPVLKAMGQNIFHAGDVGAGQVAKMCNNMLLSVLMLGTSEALQLGIKNGLAADKLSEIMLNSSGRNWVLEGYNPCPGVMENVPAGNDYLGGFMVDLMSKDLGLAMSAAVLSNAATPLGSLAHSLYAMHGNKGNGTKDFSSVFDLFSEAK